MNEYRIVKEDGWWIIQLRVGNDWLPFSDHQPLMTGSLTRPTTGFGTAQEAQECLEENRHILDEVADRTKAMEMRRNTTGL